MNPFMEISVLGIGLIAPGQPLRWRDHRNGCPPPNDAAPEPP